MKPSLILPLLLAALLPSLHASSHQDYLDWHQACLEADSTATIDSYLAKFQASLDANPNDHLARVYFGSAKTLRSAKSFWGPAKLDYLKDGGLLMDQAVDASPKDPRVRFIRATNSYKVPKRFDRRSLAVEDFKKLIPIAIGTSSNLTLVERQAVLYYGWLTMKDAKEQELAERARSKCHQLDPQSFYGKATGK